MTNQQLQIAVAEKMGWKKSLDFDNVASYYYQCFLNGDNVSELNYLPPYSTSIDAIQKVALEKFDGDMKRKFQFQLWKVRKKEDFIRYEWQLTAADWCEAFLATIKEIEK